VPLDGSAFGEQALPYALTVARRAGARVELMHVHTPLEDTYAEMQIYDVTLGERMREQARQYLLNLAQDLRGQAQLQIGTVAEEGPVHVDLVVLTTHARGALGRFWLGSIADRLIREVAAPLLVVPPAEKGLPPGGAFTLKEVLIPLDGSPLGEEILPAALTLGRLLGATYTLLRVVQPLPALEPMPLGAPGGFVQVARAEAQQLQRMQQQLLTQAEEYLAKIAAPLRQEGLSVRTVVAPEDQPARAILQTADIGLIAMATHGRHGLNRLFRGSVTDKVLRGTTVPVLVQRPTKLEALRNA
jgi:nucleotide-binding universal stress UspA family protein